MKAKQLIEELERLEGNPEVRVEGGRLIVDPIDVDFQDEYRDAWEHKQQGDERQWYPYRSLPRDQFRHLIYRTDDNEDIIGERPMTWACTYCGEEVMDGGSMTVQSEFVHIRTHLYSCSGTVLTWRREVRPRYARPTPPPGWQHFDPNNAIPSVYSEETDRDGNPLFERIISEGV